MKRNHHYITLFLLVFAIFNSCTKQNSVTIIETTEEFNPSYKMTVNGIDIETNAFAAYCQTDTSEFIIIANKEENLSLPLEITNFEIGDYAFYKSTTDSYTWSYGSQAFGEEVTDFPGLLILSSDANINIESNDGEIVVGSSNGLLIGLNEMGELGSFFSYEMNFTALIIKESDFCK